MHDCVGQGGVLGIKIGWMCDLDRAWERCQPQYSFTRLDGHARALASGYNFRYHSWPHRTRVSDVCAQPSRDPRPSCRVSGRHARYYRWPDGSEHRTLTKAFGIRFDVLVYGNVGVGLGPPALHETVGGVGVPGAPRGCRGCWAPHRWGFCTPRLGSLASSLPSSTQWQLSPPLEW